MAIQAKYTPEKGLHQNNVEGFASASLATIAPIALTSKVKGEVRNGQTFSLVIDAPAANPADTVLATFSGTRAAVTLTIVPNDGTNNGVQAVNITTAQVAELIREGSVAGLNVTLSDPEGLRRLQSASGGGADNVAAGGEGDDESATFLGAPSAEFHVKGTSVSSDLQTNRHQVVKITTVADSASLYGSTISLSTPTETFKLFLNRAAPNNLAVPAGATNVELSADGGDTDAEVATALEAVIEALGAGGAAFDSAANNNEITVQSNTIGEALLPDMGTSGMSAEVLSSGSGSTITSTTGVTIFNSTHDEAASLTLGSLTSSQAGTLKLIQQKDVGTANKDITVALHDEGNDKVFRFNAANEYACLIWLGSEWSTVSATAGVQQA
jgi:hypothetical protein